MIKKFILQIFSDKEIINEFTKRFNEDIHDDTLTTEESNALIEDISRIEGVNKLFRSLLKKDRIRYFNAPDETKDHVKGAFMRTLWFYKNIQKEEDKRYEKVKSKTKHSSPKHA